MSACVQYVTDMKKIHTTGDRKFLSCALSFCPLSVSLACFLALSGGIKENHFIILIVKYQRQMDRAGRSCAAAKEEAAKPACAAVAMLMQEIIIQIQYVFLFTALT